MLGQKSYQPIVRARGIPTWYDITEVGVNRVKFDTLKILGFLPSAQCSTWQKIVYKIQNLT